MRNERICYWRIAAAVLLLALPPLSAEAAEPYLVKDINPSTFNSMSEFPGVAVGSVYYFAASDGMNGEELWRSDGTAAGTVMVKDIYPDTDSMGYANSSHPYSLTNVNGVLYFVANDGTHGEELWRSDGTAVGTVMVKDIYLGTHGMGENGSYPSHLTNVNGTLYFSASDGTNGEELWRSDGTAAGTVMVKDIYLGINSWGVANSSSLSLLTNVNGLLYFRADDGTHGPEVWRSDGTARPQALSSSKTFGRAQTARFRLRIIPTLCSM
ncbi:MAG: ELWxxDGT repeat protein [Candidatus Electronema sp. VV]